MRKLIFLLFFTLAVSASTVWSQCRSAGSIKFPRGQSTATVAGKISSARAVCYKFQARTGQTLTASLLSPGGRVRFSIIPDAFDIDDEVTGDTTNWQGKLDGSYGDEYIVSIHVPKGSDTYSFKITIK